ncbi:hypothetical protein ACOMHN_012102 [Nucella lapillus]
MVVALWQGLSKGLSMVVTQPGGRGEEPMEVEGERTRYNWLLKHMPSLPMFPHVKVKLCRALRQAIQVETDPELVNSYITFLSQHAMDQDLNILDDLVLDVSQLIVDRSSVMNHILPDMAGERGDDYQRSLQAFLHTFHTYLAQARRHEKGEYSWSNTQDQIILQWKSGQSATMHILVVHAMVIILSYGQPKDVEVQDMYQSLLEVWFPVNDSMPKAFLLDTSEEALLLPDWLKLRMIRSSEARLVDAALTELNVGQMLLFVQSFGIPVASMTHLLTHLDRAAQRNPGSLMKSVQEMNDPSYISRLILIQRRRGAQGGDHFYDVVTEGGSIPAALSADMAKKVDRPTPPTVHIKPHVKTETPTSPANLASHFFKMFSAETKPQEAAKSLQHLMKVLSADGAQAAALLQAMAQRLESSEGREFVQQLVKQTARACPIFKILITKHKALHPSLASVLQSVVDGAGSSGRVWSVPSLFRQFLQAQSQAPQHNKPLSRRRQASLDLLALKSQGSVSPRHLVQGVEALGGQNRLEPVVKQLMQESLQNTTTPTEGLALACTMLAQASTQSVMNTTTPTEGLALACTMLAQASTQSVYSGDDGDGDGDDGDGDDGDQNTNTPTEGLALACTMLAQASTQSVYSGDDGDGDGDDGGDGDDDGDDGDQNTPTPTEGLALACTMLAQASTQGPSAFARECLLMDWLELLDPEIVRRAAGLQEGLAFGSQGWGPAQGRRRRMPYLLALLTHQSQWSTLRRCLASTLTPEKLSVLDPTNVLDFVWACRHSPKIWQGRELSTTQGSFSRFVQIR